MRACGWGGGGCVRGGRGLLLASCSVAALLIGGGTPASAAECSILQNAGTVASLTNSTTPLHDQCIHVTNGAGVTGDVTNTNTGILTGLFAHHTGIIIDQAASVGGSIINSGTISHPCEPGVFFLDDES